MSPNPLQQKTIEYADSKQANNNILTIYQCTSFYYHLPVQFFRSYGQKKGAIRFTPKISSILKHLLVSLHFLKPAPSRFVPFTFIMHFLNRVPVAVVFVYDSINLPSTTARYACD